jgi:putative nucleotidyltransferase with HDIG domain
MAAIRLTHNAVVGFRRALCPAASLSAAHRTLRDACEVASYSELAPGWLGRIDPGTDGYLLLEGNKAALPVRRGRAVGCLVNPVTPPDDSHKTTARRDRIAMQAQAKRERHSHESHGSRVTTAFHTLESFPALVDSRDRLLSALTKDHVATADAASAVESDIALTIAVLRLANSVQLGRARIDTVASAVECLSAQALRALADRVGTFDFFEHAGGWGSAPERLRLHALATQRAAYTIASEVGYDGRDRLAATSLLHDIGKLVLTRAFPGYPAHIHNGARTPEERIHQERREIIVEHALIGGVLIRRWGLPESLARAIERHHDPQADGEAAIIRLADMLAHYEQGAPVSPNQMFQCARAVGLGPERLRRLIYEWPGDSNERQRPTGPCPLSGQEVKVLQRLATGSVYKQIAHELALSVSTVRTHLHNIYGKLGVGDRAQAVLLATERGWL